MEKYLTTKELADLLRLKERKVYDLAAAGEVPCTRATGKLLFPLEAVSAWLEQNTVRGGIALVTERPGVVLGSHDPLLEWALRESGSGLATYFDSSRDGLTRFAGREGLATGLHLFDAQSGKWNVPCVEEILTQEPVVLVEWAWRQRGLIVGAGNPLKIHTLSDLQGHRIVPRQPSAGSQLLLEQHLTAHGFLDDVVFTAAALSEADAALAVQEGKADAAFGLGALAAQYRLAFLPVTDERFDLLIDRRNYFEPPLQALFSLTQTKAFKDKAAELAGYDVSGLGTVRFNGN